MRLRTIVLSCIITLVIGSLGIYWWHISSFDRDYKKFLLSSHPDSYFSESVSGWKGVFSTQNALQGFQHDMKKAKVYKRTSKVVIMYWSDASGYSSPVIWKKIRGSWRIISL